MPTMMRMTPVIFRRDAIGGVPFPMDAILYDAPVWFECPGLRHPNGLDRP
jgi:hypothetical protein